MQMIIMDANKKMGYVIWAMGIIGFLILGISALFTGGLSLVCCPLPLLIMLVGVILIYGQRKGIPR